MKNTKNINFSDRLLIGDTVFEDKDSHYLPSYGLGTVINIFSTGHFIVQYEERTLPIMHSNSGIRYDKDGSIGARRVKIIEDIIPHG